MDLSKLDNLKELLQTGKDFGKIWEYFMDNFGENDQFMNLGKRHKDPILEQILSQMTTQIFGKEMPVKDVMLVSVPEKSFVHGGCILGNKIGNVFYFEDASIGLLTIVWSFNPTESKLIRFSPRPAVRMPHPSVN